MKISQDRAREIAANLTVKAKEGVEKLQSEYTAEVVKFYNAQIPKEVHDFAKKFPQHIRFSDAISMNGHGFNREYVSLPERKSIVSNVEGYTQAQLVLNDKSAQVIQKAKNKWLDAKKNYEALLKETRAAIITLGTTKRIQADFPIAVPFLGAATPIYPVPAVNLAPLKAKLAKLQKV